ncbi:MAG: DnaD domain protein [Dehalococcoidia bacterium]|nr:DnaD domain protein [Dehalococcoidia bacterium]
MPAPLLGSLLAQIDDMAELKCTLRAVALLSQKRGYPRFVTLQELQADESLLRAIPVEGETQPAELIEKALGNAVRRGTLAFAIVNADGRRQPIFGLNSEFDRTALEKAASQPPPWSETHQEPPDPSVERPNVFEMYEQNIGMMSPMIADALLEAEEMYPEEWIEDAIEEAVVQNKRSWRYISRILERWELEGRGPRDVGGTPRMAGRY